MNDKPSHIRKLIERNTKHGLMRTSPLYRVWKNMRSRCNQEGSSNFQHYGGRGIRVCPEWDDFKTFHEWAATAWRPGLQIDRIDVNGNYEPKNCRWVTAAVNSQNRRSSKLTTEQVVSIFFASGAHGVIAETFGVSRSQVQQIKARTAWKNVTTTL